MPPTPAWGRPCLPRRFPVPYLPFAVSPRTWTCAPACMPHLPALAILPRNLLPVCLTSACPYLPAAFLLGPSHVCVDWFLLCGLPVPCLETLVPALCVCLPRPHLMPWIITLQTLWQGGPHAFCLQPAPACLPYPILPHATCLVLPPAWVLQVYPAGLWLACSLPAPLITCPAPAMPVLICGTHALCLCHCYHLPLFCLPACCWDHGTYTPGPAPYLYLCGPSSATCPLRLPIFAGTGLPCLLG